MPFLENVKGVTIISDTWVEPQGQSLIRDFIAKICLEILGDMNIDLANRNQWYDQSYLNKNTSGSISGEASAGFGLFSASVDAAFNHVISNVSSLKTLSYTEESSATEFNPKFLQIIREVTIEAQIGKEGTKTIETRIVDSSPIDKPLSSHDLQKKSEDFIKLYDDGSRKGITIGNICSFTATRAIKSKG